MAAVTLAFFVGPLSFGMVLMSVLGLLIALAGFSLSLTSSLR